MNAVDERPAGPPEFPDTICRYLCGGCGYDEVAPWSQHQAHYEAHIESGEWTRG